MIQNRQKTKTVAKQKKPDQVPSSDLTFLEHFYELRTRLFWVVLTLVVTSAIGFQYKDQLISIVMAPLHGEKLVYLTPAGGFSFIFTLSIYFGVLLSIPAIIYQIYKFLRPLLGAPSRRFAVTLMSLSVLLAAGGAAFGYFVTIPGAINFLSDFAGDAITPNLTAESYLNFVVAYVIGLAALFQLPLLLFMFDHIRPIPPGSLSSTQRFVIIGATILAAVITPTPDAINMMIVAIPIIVVYEFGALAVFIRRQMRKNKNQPVVNETLHAAQSVLAQSAVIPNDVLATVIENEEVRISPAPSAQQPSVSRRTIDGVIVVRPPSTFTIPPRKVSVRPTTPERPMIQRQLRSIDGMVIA